MKIPLVGAELFQTDRRIEMTKLIPAFRNFAKALVDGRYYVHIIRM